MKKTPDQEKLEQMLRSGKLVAGGFMGHDQRSVYEIIEADNAELERYGVTAHQVAQRMREITETAKAGLGNFVEVNDRQEAAVYEAKGFNISPWPEAGRFPKRVTTLKDKQTGESIRWSDLNIHLVDKHSFFEGKGANYRLEPAKLVQWLFGDKK